MASIRDSVWAVRDFRVLLGGQLVSFVGDQAQNGALPLLVLALTGSPVQAGLVLGLHTLAFLLFGPVAGALADRYDRKRLMIGCELGRFAVTGAVALATALSRVGVPGLVAAAALTGMVTTVFDAASNAALPNVVGPDRLPAALGASQSVTNVVRTAGSTLAGALYQLGRAVPFVVNAASFLVSALSLRLLRTRFQQERTGPRAGLVGEVRAGLGWLWGQPVLRFLTVMGAADMLRYGAGYLVIITLARRVGATPLLIGVVFSGAASGAVVGSLLAARAVRRFRLGTLVTVMGWVSAAAFPLYAVAPSPLWLAAVAAAESVLAPVSMVALSTYRLRLTPDRLRGRTAAAVGTLTTGAQSVGTMLGGVAIAALGAVPVVWLSSAWLLVLAVLLTLHRGVRRAPRASEVTAAITPEAGSAEASAGQAGAAR
jgi:MFS family permease